MQLPKNATAAERARYEAWEGARVSGDHAPAYLHVLCDIASALEAIQVRLDALNNAVGGVADGCDNIGDGIGPMADHCAVLADAVNGVAMAIDDR